MGKFFSIKNGVSRFCKAAHSIFLHDYNGLEILLGIALLAVDWIFKKIKTDLLNL